MNKYNCKCNEHCYFIEKIECNIIDGIRYIEYYYIYKCNRLSIDNSKKKPCDFYSKLLIKKKVDENSSQTKKYIISDKCIKTNDIYTIKRIKQNINKLAKFYYKPFTNFYGTLNHNLKLLGFSVHDPQKETFEELKIRLTNPENNISHIHLNNNSLFSQTIGEYNYDYDEEYQMYKRVENDENILEYNKDDLDSILDIINRDKKYIKHSKNMKQKYIEKKNKDYEDKDKNEEHEHDEDDEEDDDEEYEKEDNDEENDNIENIKENDNIENIKENENIENIKENEFDVENNSDDDDYNDNDDYDDFSD